MAALNIANSTVVNGRTSVANVTTVPTSIVSNPAASDDLIKLNTIYVHNRGNAAADISVLFVRGASTVVLANAMTVPTRTTLTLLARDMTTYLEEGDGITAFASANSFLNIFVSYEFLA